MSKMLIVVLCLCLGSCSSAEPTCATGKAVDMYECGDAIVLLCSWQEDETGSPQDVPMKGVSLEAFVKESADSRVLVTATEAGPGLVLEKLGSAWVVHLLGMGERDAADPQIARIRLGCAKEDLAVECAVETRTASSSCPERDTVLELLREASGDTTSAQEVYDLLLCFRDQCWNAPGAVGCDSAFEGAAWKDGELEEAFLEVERELAIVRAVSEGRCVGGPWGG